jgi:WD40 repeat protein/ABC-type dipeptide/oligopeptide/nickel transport system ATPase component
MPRYALVIGIAKYDNFTNLPKAVNDAEKIAQLLREHGRFDVQPIPGKLIESENRWQVTPDKKLIGKELGQTLRTFLLEKAKGSEALIYFAGHGFEALNLIGEPEGFLATSDCHKVDGQNAIAFDHFNTLIAKSQLSSLVVLLDCCYGGSFLERSFIRSGFSVFNSKQDYSLITASRAFERAREDSEGGIFTKAILKGLAQDKAEKVTGEINVNDLMSFISRELKGSGQEAIYMGGGRSIPLVWYPPQNLVATEVVSEECPYRGLEAFDKVHAKFFFGRQQVVNKIQQKLEQATFVPIIGASGSGKSSVVRAGLIPVLEKNNWRVLEIILPGIEPLVELKRAFTKWFGRTEIREISALIDANKLSVVISRLPVSERFLLVVDQFEEVFTLCSKEEDRSRFIKLITQCSESRLAIVTTIRADFLELCLSYEELTQLIQEQAVYMPPLLGAELEEAIASPANLQGYQLQRGLLGAIQQEVVGQERGCLPLLQFALTELWEQRDQETHQLTVAKFNNLGGVIGALNRHAEKLYESFTGQQDWVKRIFLKLVRTGTDEKDTRQRLPKTKLLNITSDDQNNYQAISDVLEQLIQGRLIVLEIEATGEVWADLAHEALMEGWERFTQWRQEGRELRRLIDRVEDALREWQKQPKDENLMMGGLLAQVREKWPQLKLDLDIASHDFYQCSDAYEKDRIDILERALTQATLREKATRVLNLLPFKPLDGLVLAIQAIGENLDKMPDQILTPVQNSLHKAMETVRVSIAFLGHEGTVNSVAISPNGQMIVSGSLDGTVRLWDILGNPIGQPFQGHRDSVNSVAISPDGQMIVSGSRDNTIRLWNIQGRPIGKPFDGHQGYVTAVAFSTDGQMIASGSWDKTVRLWDLGGNIISQPFYGHEDVIFSVVFSTDSQMIASGSWDNTVRLWDIQGHPIGKPFWGHEREVYSVAFSPDGQKIVSGSRDRTLRLWDLAGSLIGQPLSGHEDSVLSVAFSPDGQKIVSGSGDNTVRLWDLVGNTIGQPFREHENIVWSVAFSPDGQKIVSGSRDRTLRLWDLTGNSLAYPFKGHESSVNSVAVTPDEQKIVSGSGDGIVRLWNIQGKSIGKAFQGHEDSVRSVAVSPNGEKIISGSDDGTVRLWDMHGRAIAQPLCWHGNVIFSVAVSPDGEKIVTGSNDGTVRLWDMHGRAIAQLLQIDEGELTAINFSHDGQKIVSGSREGKVQLWDIKGNQISHSLQDHEGSVTAIAFSPDGQKIVSASIDNTVRLWDLAGNPIGQPFWGHENYVWSVAFSPDGQKIVSGSDDNTLRLWDLAGNPIGQPFRGHEDSVWSVAFSPNGQWIVSGSDDGTIRLWRGDWQAWLQVCCDRIRYHPIFINPQTEETKAACETCHKYVWSKEESQSSD